MKDGEGLYDEPAFNATLSKSNPVYQSTEDVSASALYGEAPGGVGGGGLDGYLDVQPGARGAAEDVGYLDSQPKPAAEDVGYLEGGQVE